MSDATPAQLSTCLNRFARMNMADEAKARAIPESEYTRAIGSSTPLFEAARHSVQAMSRGVGLVDPEL